MQRRRVLATVGTGITALAGCSAITGDDGSDGPPVVGDAPQDNPHTLRVEVTVTENGDALGDTPVVFHDHGGSYDRLEGSTGSSGTIVFQDSVGPAPCNPIEIELPQRGILRDVGCHNGGKTVTETIDVGASRQ